MTEKAKLNKAIIARWALIKKSVGYWIKETLSEPYKETDEYGYGRQGLISALNVMIAELGDMKIGELTDEYNEL
jgi:hypothetical protein